ncbi:N-formylglutamate amidohydrolase [Lichenicoccus sp.]|uniref:N-formylglutamate amidohydrolase n=1 Tax=Lichenicoccus sp. TaxID=2781899 RepID=UPI003D129799
MLIGPDDPPPVTVLRAGSTSPFVLASDHAGRAIPAALGDLGVAPRDLDRHIAWDIGVAGTGVRLSAALDAPLVAQAYSRLVIDCNRRPGHVSSIPLTSDGTPVPGNHDLSSGQRAAREREIFAPYHARLAAVLDHRRAVLLPSVLVALHSFTPQLGSPDRPTPGGTAPRPWHVGLLHNHDPRFALILRDLLRDEGDLVVGDNEPYELSDLDDYTVPVHGEQRGLPQVEIEIRQDLIGDAAGEAAWAARLARLLPLAWARTRTAVS